VDIGCETTALVAREPARDGLFSRLGLPARTRVVRVNDVDLPELFAQLDVDVVFNLAGYSRVREALDQPANAFAANTAFVWTLLDAMRSMRTIARVVHASTDAVYGSTTEPATETYPLLATGPYEASKIAGEIVVRCFHALYRMPVVIARMSNVYGEDDENLGRLIPDLVTKLRVGETPVLNGGGLSVRSFIHVEDAIDALFALADRADQRGVMGETFNVPGIEPISTLEVARLAIAQFGGKGIEPIVRHVGSHETSFKFSSGAKIAERVGWRPKISLADGLARLAQIDVVTKYPVAEAEPNSLAILDSERREP
jgi:nucleoside-diphosphate-sugar epimerase